MIHHLSIPASDTRHVAEVLAEVLGGGTVTAFGPHRDSWIAWAGDEHGTAVEVYPVGTEMVPPPTADQAQFRHDASASGFTATHAAISVPASAAEIHAIAERGGWRALRLDRGGFEVIELWVEDRVMLELLTPAMAAAYLAIVPRPT
jgi:hypothetical protein